MEFRPEDARQQYRVLDSCAGPYPATVTEHGPIDPGTVVDHAFTIALEACGVAPERVEAVAHHYELFGGVSPITAITQRQADGLRQRLVSLERLLGAPVASAA